MRWPPKQRTHPIPHPLRRFRKGDLGALAYLPPVPPYSRTLFNVTGHGQPPRTVRMLLTVIMSGALRGAGSVVCASPVSTRRERLADSPAPVASARPRARLIDSPSIPQRFVPESLADRGPPPAQRLRLYPRRLRSPGTAAAASKPCYAPHRATLWCGVPFREYKIAPRCHAASYERPGGAPTLRSSDAGSRR